METKAKKIYTGAAVIAVLGAGAGGYAYMEYNSPQNVFARNEIAQTTQLKSYIKDRTKLSHKYGEQAKDKKQVLASSFGTEKEKIKLDIYKDPTAKNASVVGEGSFLGKALSGQVSEKDDKLGIELNFYNKVVEVPSKAITDYFKEVSEGKVDEINLSLNDLVESAFFSSKSDKYDLTEDQIKTIYKSIDKKAFTKEGKAITLKLNKDGLTKLAEAFKTEVKKNAKDNKISEMSLDNLVNQAKNFEGELVIKQEKKNDSTLERTITHGDSSTKLTTTFSKDKTEVVIDNDNASFTLKSEKVGEGYKESILTSRKEKGVHREQFELNLNTEKVSDNEYKLDGDYSVYQGESKESVHLKGSIKLVDKSLEYKLSAQDNEFSLKYTYDVDVKELSSNKEKVVIENFNDPVFNKTIVEVQQALTKYFVEEKK